jgi:hypothetical protein
MTAGQGDGFPPATVHDGQGHVQKANHTRSPGGSRDGSFRSSLLEVSGRLPACQR